MRFYFAFLLALLSLPASAQRLLMISGNAQLVGEQFPSLQPLVVRAVDAAGNGVANVPLQWQGPALGFRSSATDESGYGSATVGGLQLFQGESYVASQYTVTAPGYGSVVFTETTFSTRTRTGGAPDRFQPDALLLPITTDISGPPGTVIPRAFGVRVLASAGLFAGSPIPGVGVRIGNRERETDPLVTCQGPNNLAITNASGEAYCDVVLGSTPATGFVTAVIGEQLFFRFIPVTITAGTPCTYAVTPATQAFGSQGGASTISVSSGTGCPWTAATSSNWITITSGVSGQANGTVGYTVAPNTGAARTGTVVVADKQITITQSATGGGPVPTVLTITSTSPLPNAVAGSSYAYQFSAAGGASPYSWFVSSGTVPSGLTLNASSGLLSGTPAAAGAYGFTVSARDANNVVAATLFSLTVAPAGTTPGGGNPGGGNTGPLVITTTSLPAGVLGTAYSQTLNATGACVTNPFIGAVVNWSIVSGSLPGGLSLSPSGFSATVAGTPSQTGTFNFTVRAADTCGNAATQAFVATISSSSTPGPGQNILVVTPSDIVFSVAYTAPGASQTINLQAGTPTPYTVSTTTPWLRLSKTQGTTPDSFVLEAVNIGGFNPGTYNGSITINSGATNGPVTVPVALRVAAASNVTVGPQSLLFQHTLGSPISSQTLNINSVTTGGQTPFTIDWATDGGGTWLSVNPTSGETPRAVSVLVDTRQLNVGVYQGTIRVRPVGNANGTVLVPVTAVVTPVSTLAVSQRQVAFNGPGSQTIELSSTGAALAFRAETNGAPWLTVEPSTGVTPSVLTIRTNASGLAPGPYTGTVAVIPTNGAEPVQIVVTFNVTAGQPAITGVTNAASFAPGAVAPGELVTIFGNNLGPATLVSGTYDAAGTLQKTVGNVQVTFDGIPAPVVYAAAGQVTAIVPFGVFGRTSTKVQITNNGVTSNLLDLQVADAAPGIFMLDTAGQGAILNQDQTVNARLNGAEPGSIISIYATGAGQMEGTQVDGQLVLGTPKPLLPVGVRIGGRVADVIYAGAAPGLVGGMLQVNARVPADTPRGTTVPVQLIVGTATSQPNVFLATRP